ncbi:MAG: UDP-N-acetylmuramate--L-alanine ligase [Clostridia bacterium]|nr:UDP-N-acetylmuramate--L-alanine ligase [Clostridia bacterium]
MALPNTHLGASYIQTLLDGDTPKKLFFDGIGGISMNALAHISHLRGHIVSGYDRTPSPLTKKLEDMGIKIYYTSESAHAADADALIYTVALGEDNPEYCFAGEHYIPRISRADYLGYLMSGYKKRIGISGTHGKSTTTGMVSQILTTAGVQPTVFNGAEMKQSGSVDIIGDEEYFVFEACEYMDSFLDFCPTTAVVLNIELDHVDYFSSLEQIRQSFGTFMSITGKDGWAVLNGDDPDCLKAAEAYTGNIATFGVENPDCDFYAVNIRSEHGRNRFAVCHKGETLCEIALQIPGRHTVSDAMAAFCACYVNGIAPDVIAKGLEAYSGICRRMDFMGKAPSGADVYSDYAHHPTELAGTLAGAGEMEYNKMLVVFQPHTFSRTHELFADFVKALSEAPLNELVLCPIYPARETNIYGVSSEMLCEAIRKTGKQCRVIDTFAAAAEYCSANTTAGDMILVMGAGDIIHTAEMLVEADT